MYIYMYMIFTHKIFDHLVLPNKSFGPPTKLCMATNSVWQLI